MKRVILAVLLCCDIVAALAQSAGVYVGGHIRRERPQTVTKLKNSGFTYAILFNINVEPDGTLTTDGETVCKDGEYVFQQTQPYYADDVEALKTWPTGIQRLEICIGGWGNESYQRIKDLIADQGFSQRSILYRNFKALKDALPAIDAVNNDDENCYDVSSAVRFHVMMAQLGYKTTIAPYTNRQFWQSLVTQLNQSKPGACDLILVQCYDGGAQNNPADWHLAEGLPIHAGRTNYQTDMATSIAQMQSWHDGGHVSGGFVWVYNDETWNLNQWAAAINRVFQPQAPAGEEDVVTLFSDNNFAGYAVSLPVGEYCTGELAARGIADKDIASFRIADGYQLTTFTNNDLTGTSKVWTDAEMARMGAWGNRLSSLKIEKTDDESAIDATATPTPPVNLHQSFDLLGRHMSTIKHPTPAILIKNGRKVVSK